MTRQTKLLKVLPFIGISIAALFLSHGFFGQILGWGIPQNIANAIAIALLDGYLYVIAIFAPELIPEEAFMEWLLTQFGYASLVAW